MGSGWCGCGTTATTSATFVAPASVRLLVRALRHLEGSEIGIFECESVQRGQRIREWPPQAEELAPEPSSWVDGVEMW